MPASEKQLAANRANATQSTGPRSAEGKARSKMNAVTHGLTAQSAVLRGEKPEQLEALSDALLRELAPRGVVQRLVAERIVSLTWKLRRAARAEEVVGRQMDENAAADWEHRRMINEASGGKLFAGLGPKPRKRDGATILADSFEVGTRAAFDGRMVRITQYELKLDAALRAAVRELRQLQKDQEDEDRGEEATPDAAPVAAAPAEGGPDSEDEPAAPVAEPAADAEKPVDKTNPIPLAPDSAEVIGITTVTETNNRSAEADPTGGGSSAPAPRTSAPPPPGPRP